MPERGGNLRSPAPTKNSGRLRCATSWQATMSEASSSGERYCTSSRKISNATLRSFAASHTATNIGQVLFEISGSGFSTGLVDANLDIAYLDLERCNEISEDGGRLANFLSRLAGRGCIEPGGVQW